MSQMGCFLTTVAGGTVNTLTGDLGGAIGPLVGNINILGGLGDITVTGNPGLNTLWVEITSTTNHSILLGNITGGLASLGVALNGQIPIGAGAGNDPVLAVPTNGNNITWTAGAGSLRADVTGTTQYAIQVGDATGSLDSLALGTATQVLQSGGAGANPAWSTATYPATTAQGDVIYSSAANTIVGLAKDATATRYLANTGALNNPAWDQVNLANGVTGTLPVANGGTGVTSITDHSLIVGSGTAAVTELGVAVNGAIPIGSTGNDPVLALPTNGTNITWTGGAGTLQANLTGTTDHTVQVGNATGSLTSLAVGTNGQCLLGSTGADPVFATLTSIGGTIAFTPGAGSLNLEAVGGGGGLVWSVVTGAAQAMAVNNGYITNRGAGVTYTLPAVAAVGDRIQVTGILGLWTIAQNAGQTVHFGSSSTTTGFGGSLAATHLRNTVELVCVIANTDFNVISSIGSITVT